MLAKTASVALVGTEARLVEVEVDVGEGIPRFTIVGLPARSVREAEQRVRSALVSSGQSWPQRRMVANLAPGSLPKEGSHFDLPIALGLVAGDGRLDAAPLEGWVILGELALDGSVRPVRGALAAAIACRASGRRGLICPGANAGEAALVAGLEIVPVAALGECLAFLRGDWTPPPPPPGAACAEPPSSDDLREVRGHPGAKRALEVAAAGGHNLLLSGPPGSGKTMLARRLPGLLPPMSPEESLEVTRIYSVAGLLGEGSGLIRRRPFRSPHHHVSAAGLVGGGSGLARPGEVSLAHHGVLFLDEITLYRREAIETLRGPLEDGEVRIARSAGSIRYPCRFALVGAMNPCACGYLGDACRACRCSERQLQDYRGRLSGPLLDRFDLSVTMGRLTRHELLAAPAGDASEQARLRVERARIRQAERYRGGDVTNASVPKRRLEAELRLGAEGRAVLSAAIDSLALSGRAVDRILRVGRTLADLTEADEVQGEHVGEALSYRALEHGGRTAA